MKTRTAVSLWSLIALSCATPGSRPHEMSAAEHDATARNEETIAADHQAQHDPAAAVVRERCSPRPRALLTYPGTPNTDVCWSSVTNPTAAHRQIAEDHRKRAADHRAGSAALRDAEAKACVGLAPEARDTSPFEHLEDIEGVAPVIAQGRGKVPENGLRGATITFRAVPGMTAEWLQRLVDCHLARNAALGHVAPQMPDCPLVPNGATATVSSTGNGFAVSVESSDLATAKEILARAQRLVAPRVSAAP